MVGLAARVGTPLRPASAQASYLESLLMTRMRAPFSSFSLWLSDFSSVKICRETRGKVGRAAGAGGWASGDAPGVLASPPPHPSRAAAACRAFPAAHPPPRALLMPVIPP